MHWSAEEFALVITGFLFLAAVASSFLPRVELTRVQQAALAIGAAAVLGSAVLSARTEDAHLSGPAWAALAFPVAALAVIVTLAHSSRSGHPTRASALDEHAPEAPSGVTRTSVLAPRAVDSPARRVLLARAADPGSSAQELLQIACRHPHLRAVVAANPSTPASTLDWLASHGDPEIREAIALRSRGPSAAAALPAL